MPLHT